MLVTRAREENENYGLRLKATKTKVMVILGESEEFKTVDGKCGYTPNIWR